MIARLFHHLPHIAFALIVIGGGIGVWLHG